MQQQQQQQTASPHQQRSATVYGGASPMATSTANPLMRKTNSVNPLKVRESLVGAVQRLLGVLRGGSSNGGSNTAPGTPAAVTESVSAGAAAFAAAADGAAAGAASDGAGAPIKHDVRAMVDAVNRFCSVCQMAVSFKLAAVLNCEEMLAARTVRFTCIRAARYAMCDRNAVDVALRLRVPWLILRSFDRDDSHKEEVVEAMKFALRLTELASDVVPLSMIAALVSIAESPAHFARPVAVRTLCEIGLRQPRAFSELGGLRLSLMAIMDAQCSEVVDTVSITLAYLLNEDSTRQHVNAQLDVERLFAPISDVYVPRDAESQTRRDHCRRAIVVLLRSWAGLLIAGSNANCVSGLVNALYLEKEENQSAGLEVLFSLFRLGQPVSDARMVIFDDDAEEDAGGSMPRRRAYAPNMLDTYMSALLYRLVHCGLIEALVHLGTSTTSRRLSDMALVLLAEVLRTAHVLPVELHMRVQGLPCLVNPAGGFGDLQLRSRAANMVGFLQQHARWHQAPHWQTDDLTLQLVLQSARRSQQQAVGTQSLRDMVSDMKRKVDAEMDDSQFQQMLRDSNVLATKDHTRWQLDVITELLSGPLRLNQRVQEALRGKFFKRLLSFLRPTKVKFWRMPQHIENVRYVRVAVLLMEALMATKAGTEYLASSRFLPELAAALAIELESVPEAHTGRVFKPMVMRETLAIHYFHLMGVLSGFSSGVELLTKHQVLGRLYSISELKARDDLNRLMLSCLDPNVPGHALILIGKLLTAGSKAIRLYGTQHLRDLLRAGVREKDFAEWGVELLVSQLGDSDKEVVSTAISVLEEACCSSDESLESLVAKRPDMASLRATGRVLGLRMLGSQTGIQLLSEYGWVDEEWDHWVGAGCEDYVRAAEHRVLDVLSSDKVCFTTANLSLLPSMQQHNERVSRIEVELHFFGQLAKTATGCTLMSDRGIVARFAEQLPALDACDSIGVRAALWSLGHIGASSRGFALLAAVGAPQRILALASGAQSCSMRGTALHALGLLSRCKPGLKFLRENRWDAPPLSSQAVVALPRDPEQLFNMGAVKRAVYDGPLVKPMPRPAELPSEVLDALAELVNGVTREQAGRTLKRLRMRDAAVFASLDNLLFVEHVMTACHYHLADRRLVHDLFADALAGTAGRLGALEAAGAEYFQ